MLRNFSCLAALFVMGAGVFFATPALASQHTPEEGFDYRVLATPQPMSSQNKVEVMEFFWYDCPHCNAMAPLIEPWAKRNRGRLDFIRVPVARNEGAIQQQHLYYALEEMGKIEKLHVRIFDAIHKEKIALKSAGQMADFLAMKGIEKSRFLKAFNSPAVREKVRHAQELTTLYGVESVPTVAVGGRYVTSSSMLAGNSEDTLRVVDYLVTQSKRPKP